MVEVANKIYGVHVTVDAESEGSCRIVSSYGPLEYLIDDVARQTETLVVHDGESLRLTPLRTQRIIDGLLPKTVDATQAEAAEIEQLLGLLDAQETRTRAIAGARLVALRRVSVRFLQTAWQAPRLRTERKRELALLLRRCWEAHPF